MPTEFEHILTHRHYCYSVDMLARETFTYRSQQSFWGDIFITISFEYKSEIDTFSLFQLWTRTPSALYVYLEKTKQTKTKNKQKKNPDLEDSKEILSG